MSRNDSTYDNQWANRPKPVSWTSEMAKNTPVGTGSDASSEQNGQSSSNGATVSSAFGKKNVSVTYGSNVGTDRGGRRSRKSYKKSKKSRMSKKSRKSRRYRR